MRACYTIEPAREGDLAALPDIERSAAQLFVGLGVADAVLGDATDLEELRAGHAAGRLWVARGPDAAPVGFALVGLVDGQPHLEEIDVLPAHGGRGAGRALLEAVCAWARDAGFARLTLTTFREIAWNAPFYARAGFRELPAAELGPELAELVAEETARGLSPAHRLVMHRDLERGRS
jgi:GNAT superfamily N-acetyltransferase